MISTVRAEEGRSTPYVVIDTGNTNSGESGARRARYSHRHAGSRSRTSHLYYACVYRPRSDPEHQRRKRKISDAGVVARGRENPNGSGEAYSTHNSDVTVLDLQTGTY